MCASVNLSLPNFASNSKIVVEAMPIEDRSKDLKDLDLRHDVLPVQNLAARMACSRTARVPTTEMKN